MRLHFASDPQDPNGDLGTGDVIDFLPTIGLLTGHRNLTSSVSASPPVSTPSTPVAPTLPDESVEAMAAVSNSGSGGAGSVVAETSSSGFAINLVFDAAAMAAPASFRTGIEQAAAILSETITNKITVNLDIDYSGTGGGAAAGPDNGQFVSYSTVRADLVANAAPGDTSFNALPTGSTIQGQSEVAVWNAQLKLFGLISPNSTTTDDGSATFATDINPNLLVGVALHELTHAMGRVPYGTEPDIFDFYRFTSAGSRLFTDNIPASSAYFSLDGGNTKLADFGISSDPSDFLNAPNSNLTSNDAFDEFYSNNTLQSLTPVDLQMLDALGFNTSPLGLVVVANTADALQAGAAVSLLSSSPNINDPGSTTLSSATIKIANASGNAVAGDKLSINGIENGSLGNGVTASWNATTDTLTLSGTASIAAYDTMLSEITFQDTGTDNFSGSHPVRTVTWTIDDGTNSYSAVSTIDVDRAPVAANNSATDAVGTTLSTTPASGLLSDASDLDGDSLTVTGVSDTFGAGTVGTSLAGVYGHLTLNANGSYSYVADNAAAISSAPTGSHLQETFNYTVSDGNGGAATASLTITLDREPVVTATGVTLSTGHAAVAASSLFSASDPDGNTITTYGFEDTGSGHFVLNGVVEPNNQEIDVTAAQLSQITYQSTPGSIDTLEVRVNDGTLWSPWASFAVSGPPLVLQTDGTTALTEAGNNFFLDNTSSGSGPELQFGGSPVTPSLLGTWTPIGAVQVAGGGYDVALDNTSSGLYTVWSTDSNGNFVSNVIGAVAGNSSALEALETTFGQDLNGDGHIGIPSVVIQTDGSTALTEIGNNLFLDNTGSGSGPELQFGGAAVTPSLLGTWTPIGAVQVAGGGYDVALHNTSSGLYTVWSTDSNGNYVSNVIGAVAGNSSALEALEATFGQDLNIDGHIGIPSIVIQTDGTTALTEIGNNFFLDNTGSGSGPELQFGSAAVTPSLLGTWTPIGAVQVAGGGYDVALHNTSSGLYTVWSTDSNGNYVSNVIGAVAGNSSALEGLEPTFNQDLNGDGHIGIPSVVLQTDGTTALTEVGNNLFLDNASSGGGPELQFGGSAVTPSLLGTWTPIGAVQVAGGGYDVALHNTGSGLYTVWSTDSNGNYVSNVIGAVAGNSSALEALEPTFNQDLNGDGTIGIYAAPGTTLQVTSPLPSALGPATIGAGAILELGTADSASITFSSSTGMLKLDSLTAFTGVVANFTGNGTLSGSDQIDLKGINFNSVHDSYSNGVLTVSDGTNTATLDFDGTYVLANFKFASDGSGGTIVYDPPVSAQPQSPTAISKTISSNAAGFFVGAGQDSFVFAPTSGHHSATGWNPTTDAQQLSPSAFWNPAALSNTHDVTHHHTAAVDPPHDEMPQFHAHLGDFHIV
jgi:VCBS repeat-containing protein